jgi:hypothetical protein
MKKNRSKLAKMTDIKIDHHKWIYELGSILVGAPLIAERMGDAKVFAAAQYYEGAAEQCAQQNPEKAKAFRFVAHFLRNPRTHDFLVRWYPNHPAVLEGARR